MMKTVRVGGDRQHGRTVLPVRHERRAVGLDLGAHPRRIQAGWNPAFCHGNSIDHRRPEGKSDSARYPPLMTVAVRVVDCEQPPVVVAELAATLDRPERERAARWANPAARARWIVAHGALRSVLGAALDLEPAAIDFDRTCRHCGDPQHGKPAVVGADVEFSLSHSGALAVVAWTRGGGRLGVDVELVKPRRRLEPLAARVLDPDRVRGAGAPCPLPNNCAPFSATGPPRRRTSRLSAWACSARGETPPASMHWTVAPIDVGSGAVASVAVDRAGVAMPGPEPWPAALPSGDGRR